MGVRAGRGSSREENASGSEVDIRSASRWFAEHVELFGQPYTLDDDQVRAAIDQHHNTLVTARAGSGKTRVIVAKVAYLVAIRHLRLDEIAIFMFNRTAAAEVNERLAAVKVDGKTLVELSQRNRSAEENALQPCSAIHFSSGARRVSPPSRVSRANPPRASGPPSEKASAGQGVNVASTFHKFALDLVKASGEQPKLLSESESASLISRLVAQTLRKFELRLSPPERREMLQVVSSFIVRAGQKFPGKAGLKRLEKEVETYCRQHSGDPAFTPAVKFHVVGLEVYRQYLYHLREPRTDFNLLMARATDLLNAANCPAVVLQRISPLRYILIDEYQDFSYLFFALVQAIRSRAPAAALFAVGDDWQAINRFAGSDVDYFINFAKYFPDDVINIPLATNYRSCRRIVENANRYMLQNYDPDATPAVPKNKQNGKIVRLNPEKTSFNATDIHEDALGDGRYMQALMAVSTATKDLPPSAMKLLKTVVKIIAKCPYAEFMLLHRHNFTTFEGISLPSFMAALEEVCQSASIMERERFRTQVRCMTMHKSKGLESEIVILLELDRKVVLSEHPLATLFSIFGDNLAAEKADQHRLLYVALTRAKRRLYLLSRDADCPC